MLSDYFTPEYLDRRQYYRDLMVVGSICADSLHEPSAEEFSGAERAEFIQAIYKVLEYCAKGVCSLSKTRITAKRRYEINEENDLRML